MCIPVVAAIMIASAVMSAGAAYQQADTAKKVAKHNAQVADIQAADAVRRGDEAAARVRRDASRSVGDARAGYAAHGVDLADGTPAAVVDQLDFFGQVDEATSRSNAGKEAWALRNQAAGFQAQADAQNPLMAAGTTFLGSASQVASRWSAYRSGR